MTISIGVVDSGFRPDQQQLIIDSASFYLEEGALWMGACEFDAMDHGARIIEIIHHHLESAEIYSAQVFDQRGVTTPIQVAAAIDWLREQGVQLINLSLGLRQDREVLAKAVKRAVQQGVIICASSPARGDPVYPSAYPGVFRMTGDARCTLNEISCLETEFADFGGHVLGLDQVQSKAGASLGCAHMSGQIAKLFAESGLLDFNELAARLKQRAAYFGPEHRLY